MATQQHENEKQDENETVVTPVFDLLMDTGLLAWLQVLGSWILFMNTW